MELIGRWLELGRYWGWRGWEFRDGEGVEVRVFGWGKT